MTKLKGRRKFVFTHLACTAIIFVAMTAVFKAQYKNVTSTVPEVDNYFVFPDYRMMNDDAGTSIITYIYPTLYYFYRSESGLVPISPIWWTYTYLSVLGISAVISLVPAKMLSDVIRLDA